MVTLVRARHILTSSSPARLDDAAVAVDGAHITALGAWPELAARFPDALVVGDGEGILLPGFVNCHGHFSEGLTTGLGETMTLLEWIDRLIMAVSPHITREMARVGTLLMGAQMIRSGVTTVNDMFVARPRPREPVSVGVVEGLEALGLRGEVSYGAQDRRYPDGVEAIFAEHDALADAAARTERIRWRLGIASVMSQTEPLWQASLARVRRGAPVHVHLHEVREEVTASRIAHGRTPIGHAAASGLLETPVVAAHCVWLSDDDVELLARHGVAVAHNPVSNMILASGVCPLRRLVGEGVAVGLGTDGPASNDSQDMLETIKVAALLQKVHHLDATAMTASEVLMLATLGGARALGLGDIVGSIEVGKEADLVLFAAGTSLAAVHDPAQAVVYCTTGREVSDVWVAGERILTDRALTRVDMDQVERSAHELATELAERSGLESALRGGR
jgi:cytosine/adenosine deaminase-related metal-dependent hydrolase